MSPTTTAAPPSANGAAILPREPKHITALRRFAISITVLNIAGYAFLGFEQAWSWPFIALAVSYTLELLLERFGSWQEGRSPRYAGNGVRGLVEFLYPAHITALAVNMLSYTLDQVWTMIFGVAVAVGAKWVLRAPVNGRLRHFMNPSNFGIAVILMLFPWASIAPPYQYTETLTGWTDWILPVVILGLGTLLNAKLTGRMWLIGGWLLFFVLQALARGVIVDNAIPAALGTMTGTAFILFTNYMISDPGTTPAKPFPQFCFGAGVGVVYGLITGVNLPYGLFFATATVCLIRGGWLWAVHIRDRNAAAGRAVTVPASPGARPGLPAWKEPVGARTPTKVA